MINNNKIVVTGGSGRFAQSLKKIKSKYKFIYPSKNSLNIINLNSIKKFLKKEKPSSVLHLAGLSRPMVQHEKNISNSINLNIIGTANLVNICSELKIKLIYFSTSYVYPGKKGNYKEHDALLPWNNYAWSKLGGECAVQMYKNSLILRVSMTEKPFIHKKAFANVKLNFLFHEELAKILVKILHTYVKKNTDPDMSIMLRYEIVPLSPPGALFPRDHRYTEDFKSSTLMDLYYLVP